jgi:hypothetical protein
MEEKTYGAIVASVEKALKAEGFLLHHVEIDAGGETIIRAYSNAARKLFASLSAENPQDALG